MRNKKLKTKDPVDIILNGSPKGFRNHPNYSKALTIKTPLSENIRVKNPITGKETDIVLSRAGTTEEKLAMILLAPDATKEQKDSILASYFFERGRENASFLAELMVSKGTLLKETQAFKKQMRWDFESFANTIVLLFQDMASDIKNDLEVKGTNGGVIVPSGGDIKLYVSVFKLAQRLEKGAELITKQREGITDARMREKGFGVYLDKNGKAYSIFDDEIVEVVKKDKKEYKNAKGNH